MKDKTDWRTIIMNLAFFTLLALSIWTGAYFAYWFIQIRIR